MTEYSLKFISRVEESLSKTQAVNLGNVENLDSYEYWKSIIIYYLAILTFLTILCTKGGKDKDIHDQVHLNTMEANYHVIYILPDGVLSRNTLSQVDKNYLKKTQTFCNIFEVALLVFFPFRFFIILQANELVHSLPPFPDICVQLVHFEVRSGSTLLPEALPNRVPFDSFLH